MPPDTVEDVQRHFLRGFPVGGDSHDEREDRAMGPSMEYLLPGEWRSRRTCSARENVALAEIAERVGYGSASTFNTAFSRHVVALRPPGRYARESWARGQSDVT